jgi:hypothetical protein
LHTAGINSVVPQPEPIRPPTVRRLSDSGSSSNASASEGPPVEIRGFGLTQSHHFGEQFGFSGFASHFGGRHLLIGGWLGWNHTLFREGIFFSKASLVTFGGAYAVLPYVSQQGEEHYHWLSPGQMLDGLRLAKTTPGPLIMVLQFVGFLAGWQRPG